MRRLFVNKGLLGLFLVCLSIFSLGMIGLYQAVATPSPTVNRTVTPGATGPCTWFVSLDGTTPVALAMVGGLSVGVGDNIVGTAGQDMGTFLTSGNGLVGNNIKDCFSGQTFTFTTGLIASSYSGFTIQGLGRGSTIFSFASAGNMTVFSNPNAVQDFMISDLQIVGANSATVQNAIFLYNCKRCIFQNLDIHYFAGTGSSAIVLGGNDPAGGSTNTQITNLHSWNNWNGIWIGYGGIGATNFRVFDSYFFQPSDAVTRGWELTVNGSSTVGRISHNLFEGGQTRARIQSNFNVFEGNAFETNANAAVTDLSITGSGNSVANNQFSNAVASSGVNNIFGNNIGAGQIRFYPINEGSGTTILDGSVSSVTGTLNPSTGYRWNSTGCSPKGFFAGSCIWFRGGGGGLNGYADIGDITASITNTFTVTFWVYMNSTAAFQEIFSARKSGGTCCAIEMYFNSNNLLGAGTTSSTTTDTCSAITQKVWYLLTLVYDGTNLKLYLNNSLCQSFGLTGNISFGAGATNLARRFDAVNYCNCYLNSVRVLNTALTANQVALLYGDDFLSLTTP